MAGLVQYFPITRLHHDLGHLSLASSSCCGILPLFIRNVDVLGADFRSQYHLVGRELFIREHLLLLSFKHFILSCLVVAMSHKIPSACSELLNIESVAELNLLNGTFLYNSSFFSLGQG